MPGGQRSCLNTRKMCYAIVKLFAAAPIIINIKHLPHFYPSIALQLMTVKSIASERRHSIVVALGESETGLEETGSERALPRYAIVQ